MNWEWSFRQIPLKPRQLMALVVLILLSFWAQSGFLIDRNHLLFFISNYGFWFILLPIVYQLSQHIQKPGWTLVLHSLALIIFHWIGSNLILYSLRFLEGGSFVPDLDEIQSFLVPSMASRLIDFALFAGLLSWLHQQRTLTNQKILMAENRALLERSKLQSLKNQLNPHFLFNALHSINSLIGINDERASEMIIKMSHLLRAMLAINELDSHTLREEIDFTQQYLDIESERFKDRLSIVMDVNEQAKPIVIPTLILQPLVENAFKHGISKMTGKTILKVQVSLQDDILSLLVCNDITDTNIQDGQKGIGLVNLSDRLKAYYQDRATLETGIKEERFEALITIEP